MNPKRSELQQYIQEFLKIPPEERQAYAFALADKLDRPRQYVKTYLYRATKDIRHNKIQEPIIQEQTPAEQIFADRLINREKAAARIAEAKYKHLLKEYETLEQRFDFLVGIKEDIGIPTIEKKESGQLKSHATPVALLSDWHFEETVLPETINGLNEYNLDIAARRWSSCIQNLLRLVTIDRNHSEINEIVLWLGGDFITGYIHEELIESNSLSPTQATRFAKKLIISGIEFLLQYGKFEKIIIPCSYGNHGRTTTKKRISTGHKNSYEWMMYHDIADYFNDKAESRVRFIVPDGLFTYMNVYGFNCRFWHGDTVSYQGGIGGLTIPLIKAIHRYNQQIRADYNFMGHYHQLHQPTKDCMVNGSGIGFNPYAQGIGASPEQPMQGYCLIDQKRGLTIKAPIFC